MARVPNKATEELSADSTQSPEANEELYHKIHHKEVFADDVMELSLKSAILSNEDLLAQQQRRAFPVREVIDQDAFDHRYGFRRVNLSVTWRALFYYRQVLRWRRADWLNFLCNRAPILRWLPAYKWKSDLMVDIIGGLMISIVCVPQGEWGHSLAYGYLVGVPPIYGLITGIIGPFIYSIFGSSKHASPGAFAIVALMIGTVVSELASTGKDDCKCSNNTFVPEPNIFCCEFHRSPVKPEDAVNVAMTVTLLVGLLQIVFGLFNAGLLSVWLSDHLVQGLTSGAAIHVLTSQLMDMTGIEGLPPTTRRFGIIDFYICFFDRIRHANISCVVTSLISVLLLLLSSYVIDPIIKKWTACKFPMEFLLVAFSVLIVWLADGTNYHIEIPKLGYVESGMHVPRFPKMDKADSMLTAAIMISIVSFVIHLAMAKLCAKKLNYEIDANQEWLALGLMHSISSLFGGFAGGSSLGRTMMQVKFGTKSQAVLASIVVVALKSLFVQLIQAFKIWRQSIVDFMIFLITFCAVVLLTVDEGLVIGIAFALLTVVFRTQWHDYFITASSTRMGRIPGSADFKGLGHYKMAQEIPGVKVFRFDAPLYFANADLFINRVYRACGINPVNVRATLAKREAKVKKKKQKMMKSKLDTAEIEPADPEEVVPLTIKGKDSDSETKDSDWENEMGFLSQVEVTQVTHLVLDFSTIPFIDSMGLDAVASIYEDYRSIDIEVMLAQAKISVRQLFEATNFTARMPKNRMFVNLNDAVTQAVREQQAAYNKYISMENVALQPPVVNEPMAKSVAQKTTTPFDEGEQQLHSAAQHSKRVEESKKKQDKLLTLDKLAESPPSLSDIDLINDPVLNDVFKSSKPSTSAEAGFRPPETPSLTHYSGQSPYQPLPPTTQPTYPPARNFYGREYYYSRGEVPIDHTSALGEAQPPMGVNHNGWNQLAEQGASFLANGASAVYK
ncbi:hypothetical protein WR25_17115 [Diploscapter pachys]|uniref:STAS domain-containing protein n=1 Tax=Diploscapter pachys TaxID=2018661 RepID=A0A2A2LKR6_9BILA|nr:hypothetical protein WR25_17115 [Diploscapter pachys]